MELDYEVENKIKVKALEYMKKSRPGWNVPHLHAAVFYMKKLIDIEGGNSKILLPAIYLHDIGYAGLLSNGYTFNDNQKVKKEHMIIGANMSKEILNEINVFSESEVNQICMLISIHDDLEKIKGHDIQLVFEADSLAQIDVDKVKPNFDEENYLKFLADFKKRRVPLFKTKAGRDFLKMILPKSECYFD
ncbi:MAG: hypothetical protein U9M90_03845 [Patescibacteria group bacterium]|nr:hypothetical protein [Patescibacteria group bacterium]